MRANVPGKVLHTVAQEKAHGQPCGVRGQAEEIDVLLRLQLFIQPGAVLPGSELRERAADIFLLNTGILRRAEQSGHTETGTGGAGILSPADDCCVTEQLPVILVGKQGVERGCIGKGSVGAHRGVRILLMAVGAKCRSVEGYERGAGGLRIAHALDRRVRERNWCVLAGDEALGVRGIRVVMLIMLLPCVLKCRQFGHGAAAAVVVIGEDQVRTAGDVLPPLRQQGVRGRLLRPPGVEEGQHGVCCGVIYRIQQRMMQRGACGKALPGTLRLALFIGAEQISGVVAEKVRRNAGRAFDMCRHTHLPRGERCFFAAQHAFPTVDHVDQCTVIADLQLITHRKCIGPAGGGELALSKQRFVISSQCLQDHVTTSAFRQSSTPSTSRARKNCA